MSGMSGAQVDSGGAGAGGGGAEPSLDVSGAMDPRLNPARAAAMQRAILLRVVRAAFIVLILTVTLLTIIDYAETASNTGGEEQGGWLGVQLTENFWIPLVGAIGLSGLFLAVDLLTPNRKLRTFGGVVFGLLAGLIITVALGFVIDLIATTWEFDRDRPIVDSIKVLLGICLCYLGVSTVLQTQDDFRLVIPYVEFAKQLRGIRPLLVDSSALIDARLYDLGETGVLQGPIVVPGFVVGELQTLADSTDRLKRAKGRRGLDVVDKMLRSGRLDVTIDETPVPGKAVDQMLIERAEEMPAVIVTGDLALVRIAGFRNVAAININEVANAMKPSLVPGERLTLKLVKAGEQAGQAVGFLDDGAMVVAEDGGDSIGREVSMTVRSTLQTAAGRLIFARIGEGDGGSESGGGNGRQDGQETGSGTAVGGGDAGDEGRGGDSAADGGSGEPVGGLMRDPGRGAGPYPPKRAREGGRGRSPRR